MEHILQVKYKRVFLRPLETRDLEPLRELRNKNRAYFNDSRYISPEQQDTWYQQYLKRENDIMFAVELAANLGPFIGAVAIYNIDKIKKTAESGRIMIDKDLATSKGIGAETVFAVGLVAFRDLGLCELTCQILKSNIPSRKMHEKVGYKIVREDTDHWYYQWDLLALGGINI